MNRAAEKLRDDNIKVNHAAFDFVFDSYEGFTRTFSKQFGITPKQYSETKPEIKFFIPEEIRGYYLEIKKEWIIYG